MSRIAIVHMTFSWPPEGGASVDIHEIARRLAQHHQVRLFVPAFPAPFSRCRIHQRLPFEVARIPFTPLSFRRGLAARRFRSAVQAFRPDQVWLADGWHLKPEIAAGLADFRPMLRFYAYENLCLLNNGTLFRGGKYCENDVLQDFAACHRCMRQEPKHGFWYRWEAYTAGARKPEYPERVRRMLDTASTIIVYNSLLAARLSSWKEKVIRIPSGIASLAASTRKADSETGHRLNILAAGRFRDPAKGWHVLRNAIGLLQRERNDFDVQVTLPPERVKDPINNIGWLPPDQLRRHYLQADIVVVPSIWPEPQGIVAVEGMAAGAAVLVSAIGGLREVVSDGETGLHFNPGDAHDLAQKIGRLLDDPALRRTLGRHAREAATAGYDWDHIFRRFYLPLFS